MTKTEFTGDGLLIAAQDLSSVTPQTEDADRLYHHDGSSSIPLNGGSSTTTRGFYVWDGDDGAWSPVFTNADKLDGREAGDFLLRDGSVAMLGNLDLDSNNLLNISEASGVTGGIHLDSNHVEVHSHSAGANLRLVDSNGLLIAEALEGGNFNVPNGQLQESGNRVATRAWTNTNADVPNADYADNAGSLGGKTASAFLHVSGDQMEGTLDMGGFNLNDGGTTKYDSVAGEFVQSALGGPASSLTAYPLPAGDLAEDYVLTSRLPLPAGDLAEDYVDRTGDTMSGGLDLAGYTLGNIGEAQMQDDSGILFGTNQDFETYYESASDSWKLRDKKGDEDLMVFSASEIIVGNGRDLRIKAGVDHPNIISARASDGHIAIGDTVSDDVQVDIDAPAETLDANTVFHRTSMGNRGALSVQGSTTSPLVTSLNVTEPNIDASASSAVVTEAATARIEGAPSEGETNYALLVESGLASFGGDLTVGAQLSEQGNRVATRAWTNANADVPNADYADTAGDADTLDGEHASAFANAGHIHDSRYYTESEVDANFAASGHAHALGDLSNVTATGEGAGGGLDADLLDGVHASAFADSGHSHAHSEITSVGSDDHHAKYTNEEAQDAVGGILNTDFSYDDAGNTIALAANSVTVAGNTVALGGSTSIAHGDISSVGSSDHHTRYSDEEAQDAVGTILSGDFTYDDGAPAISLAASSLTVAGNTVSLGGSIGIALGDLSNVTASGEGSGNGFDADLLDGNHASAFADSGHAHAHSEITSVNSDDHHSRFAASEVDSSNWSDYEIQKDGTDGAGIINFKTT